jgi:hypothetical protein
MVFIPCWKLDSLEGFIVSFGLLGSVCDFQPALLQDLKLYNAELIT